MENNRIMLNDTADLTREYYDMVKHLYPDVSYDKFKKIATFPFKFTAEEIKTGNLNEVRINFFGSFLPLASVVKRFLKNIKDEKEHKYINKKNILIKFLKNHEINKAKKDRRRKAYYESKGIK